MRTREVESNARNLIDWNDTAKRLESALEYAKGKRAELEQEGYIETDSGVFVNLIDNWSMQAVEFLGTVFALCPSGKYYLPFACSNVETCPRCKGNGSTKSGNHCTWCDGLGSREAYLDQVWYETLDAMGGRFGLYITSGEGDPCDLFVGMASDLD